MSVDKCGVGYSVYTSKKQRQVRALYDIWLRKAIGAARQFRYGGFIYYFDMNAGPGWHEQYPDDGVGSPLIFCETAEKVAADYPDLRYRALMVDRSPDNIASLQRELDKRHYYNAAATCEDNATILKEFTHTFYRDKFALFYFDPTAPSDLPWDALINVAGAWKRADFLLYIPATSFKRVQNRWGTQSLMDYLRSIPKSSKSIMQPVGRHQWTFIYMTNGKPIEWPGQRLYNIESKAGMAAYERVTMTNQQLEEQQHALQPTLF